MSAGDVYLLEGYQPATGRCPGCGKPRTQASDLGYCGGCNELNDVRNQTEANASLSRVRAAGALIVGKWAVRHLFALLQDRYGIDEPEILKRAKATGLTLRQTIEAFLSAEDLATLEHLTESENPAARRGGWGTGFAGEDGEGDDADVDAEGSGWFSGSDSGSESSSGGGSDSEGDDERIFDSADSGDLAEAAA